MSRAHGRFGILDHDGLQIEQFITSGIPPEVQPESARRPKVKASSVSRSITVAPCAFPISAATHGLQATRLITLKWNPSWAYRLCQGRVFGNLYVADKLPESSDAIALASTPAADFSREDHEILEMFAAQVAIAIENAQLHRQNRQLAVLHERERIGMDLHDGVIQSIYAIGLMLDDTQHRLDADPALARDRIANAITSLNSVIRDIRTYIHDLHSHQVRTRDLAQGIEELVRDLETYSLLTVFVEIDPATAAAVTPQQSSELLHILQEALINVRKHAHASSVRIGLRHTNHRVELTIEDDGIGFHRDPAVSHSGHGLRNMAERAQNLDGALEVGSVPGRGTRITVSAPLPASGLA